jgi:hypothetical protein
MSGTNNKIKWMVVSIIILIAFLYIPSVYAMTEPKVYYHNQEIGFDQAPYIENGRTLVPVRAIAEAVGMQVSYNSATKTATLSKTERLMRIPPDEENPYVEGKIHVIEITINKDTAYLDSQPKSLDVPAKSIGGRIFVPLRFVSEAMDMDVLWMEGNEILVSDRIRGSEPLKGEMVFPTLTTDTISALSDHNKTVTLGMDVTEMQAILGSPEFVWGRGNPAPNLRYLYGDEEISCFLGKVSDIMIGPESNFKTATGISIGDKLEDIVNQYSLGQSYLSEHSFDGGIELLYSGDNMTDDLKTATHVIVFYLSDASGEIVGIEIVDVATLNEFGTFDEL